MKRIVLGLGASLLVVGLAAAQDQKKPAAPAAPAAGAPKSLQQKVSYGIGLGMSKNLKAQGIDLDLEMFTRGIRDGLGTGKPLMSDEEIEQALIAFQEELLKQKEAAGKAYLDANAKKEGVKTTASGLQYKVVKDGTGAPPKATDMVKVHYKGTLPDGTVFDSSYDRGEPATFPVNRVIKGWTEALQLMKPGSNWQLFIPADLAYGPMPPPGSDIPPNAVLLFDVELLGVEKAPAAAPVPKAATPKQ